jgi:thymidylate synthase (FAD)
MKPVTAVVKLFKMTPDPEGTIASAAKLCYASDVSGILKQDKTSAGKFVEKLFELGHLSPIEHASFTFYVEGVSRAMTHQLVRHRLASYSQRSQRYVGHADFDYVIPPALVGKKVDIDGKEVEASEYFAETMKMLAERYRQLNHALGDKGEASNEDARYVLPNACETKIFVTMNARELIHFCEQRLCTRAQWEIRGVAGQMLEILRDVCPAVFNKVGPKCVRNQGCPEGKRTCGKYREMVEKYGRDKGR